MTHSAKTQPRILRLLIVKLLTLATGCAMAQALPDRVAGFTPGKNAGFGSAFFPANVLGPPNGNSNPQTPTFSQQDVLTLGTGGSIVLEFTTNQIINGAGADFTIFENPVEPITHPEQSFAETAVVSVSQDGLIWHTFPFDMVSSAPGQVILKSNYFGFAGVMPSLSSPSNGISPFDPTVSGGDHFDLASVGLPSARFVKITDSGDYRWMPQYDTQGDIVYDYGNLLDPDPTEDEAGITAGFDLDAVAAIHSAPWQSAITDWAVYD